MAIAGNLFKNRAQNRARPEARLAEVLAFDEETTIDGCFKGTISAKLIDGPNAGKTITVALTNNGKNIRTPKVEDFTAVKHLAHTKPGGILHFDNLLETGKGHYTATWANHFTAKMDPKFVRAGILTRVMPVTKYDPLKRESVQQKFDNGAQRYRAEFLHTEEAKATANIEELKLVLAEAFQGTANPIGTEDNRAVLVVGVIHGEDGSLSRSERIIWRGYDRDAGKANDVETAVANAIENVGAENAEELFGNGGKIDIIPISWLETGKKTSEMIDKTVLTNGRAIVDNRHFQLDREDASKGFGFAPANVLIQHHTNRKGEQLVGQHAAKAYRAGAVLPISAINTPSDAEAANRFYAPLNEKRAAERAAKAEAGKPQADKPMEAAKVEAAAETPNPATAEQKAPEAAVAAAAAQASAPAAEAAVQESKPAGIFSTQPEQEAPVIEGLDDILDDIALEDFTPDMTA